MGIGSDHKNACARLHAAVEAIATSRRHGALFVLDVERASLERMRRGDASNERIAAILLRGCSIATNLMSDAEWVRTGWSRFECAISGTREDLAQIAKTLLAKVLEDPNSGQLHWRAILTRIFPGAAIRTLHCDPGYDIDAIKGSAVVWVDPYHGDDWRESQRYPTTTILWQNQ